jgi:NAD(P)-dependent dehydrogenase (short-subunit alcohol dehydrogenase family)
MMGGRLEGRVALITGGGGEIGSAIARRFAAEGAAIAIADLEIAKAEETARSVIGIGGRASGFAVDVANEASAEEAVKRTIAAFGRLTTLVNVAAAITPDGTVETLSLKQWNQAIDVNLTGAFLMCKYAVPELRRAGGGSIINIASQLGQMAVPKRSPYCTSKAALIHFSKALAIDHAKDNIRVNSLSPGAIDTPRALWRYGGSLEEARKARGPLYLTGRPGTVDEIAHGALFLASDDSSFMTAADLLIDGGYLAFKTLDTKTLPGARPGN